MKKFAIVVSALIVSVLLTVTFLDKMTIATTLMQQIKKYKNPNINKNRTVHWEQGPSTAETAKKNQPNIVLILTDDMGYNDISLYGGGAADGTLQTPHIDSIGKDGVTFMNGYAGNAVCAPSRAMLMSGRYSTRFGFEFTPTPPGMIEGAKYILGGKGEAYDPKILPSKKVENAKVSLNYEQKGMPSSEITVAELLKTKGYHTAHIGKWHLGRADGLLPNDQGFDESLLMASGLYLPEDHPEVVNSKQDFDFIDQFLWASMQYAASFNNSEWFKPKGYITDYYTDEAVKVIEANKNRPFFLYMAHWGVHTPLQATKADYDSLSHIKDHRLRVYAAMIKSVDRSTGRILQALKDNGLEENTLVIFTSDNGGAGYVGLPNINKPFRGWKISHFEGGTHVPYLVKWPKEIKAGAIFETAVSHLDVFATAAAAAGAELPTDRKIDGVDLMPFLKGVKEGDVHDSIIWKQGDLQTILHKGWKMQRSVNPDQLFLFHLAQDPTEQHNLAVHRPKKIKQLSELLAAHNADQLEPLWDSRIKIPVAIDKTLDQKYTIDEVVFFPN